MQSFPYSHRRSRRSRGALGAVLFVWLTVTLQPCAMALPADDKKDEHRCPHCPPVHLEHRAGHAAHGAAHDAAASGAAVSAAPSCAAPDDCSPFAEKLLDTRAASPKADQGPDDAGAWIAVEAGNGLPLRRTDRVAWPTAQAPPGAISPPLFLLNCAFLQ